MSARRLPTLHETVAIRGLVSSPHLNGRRGVISSYVTKGDVRRYKVKLTLENGSAQHKILAVKPRNISLLPRSDDGPGGACTIRGDDAFYACPEWDVVHVFVPCHVGDARRSAQFRQCVASLARQVGRCRIFVGVSGAANYREEAMDVLRTAAASSRRHQWLVVEDGEAGDDDQKSQFEHLASLMSASLHINPDAWLTFLDNDDMFHPQRVAFFQEKVKELRKYRPSTKAFCACAKALIDDVMAIRRCGPNVAFPLDLFLNGDAALNEIVEIVTTVKDNGDKDTIEYFDFCVHSSILNKFVELTPDEILAHQFCDLRFLGAITNIAPPPPYYQHPHVQYLYMHYCIRQEDRKHFFATQNLEKLKVTMTEEDCELKDETGYPGAKITTLRKGVEECIVQTLYTVEEDLERSRKELRTTDRAHSLEIGDVLWDRSMARFQSYFSEDLAEQNKRWWKQDSVL